MALLTVDNVRIAGVSACVPKKIIYNRDSELFESKEELEKYIKTVGVESRRVADQGVCSSDMCYEASERLLQDLKWDKESIDCLIFVSQTPDYIYPATACILQHRLGLSMNCMSFDISMGCSGWVYGMSVVTSLMTKGCIKRALLLAGETVSKTRSPYDRVNLITGDASTATALEYSVGSSSIYFDNHTNGSGYETIIIPGGGFRNVVTPESFNINTDDDGVKRNALHTHMDGAGVFSFAISKAPSSIKLLLEAHNIQTEDVDYFLLHQANRVINNKIVKKIGCTESQYVNNLTEFGNTSSTSIPLAMVCQLKEKLKNKKCVACAFGVGLSWASMYFETDEKIICSPLITI